MSDNTQDTHSNVTYVRKWPAPSRSKDNATIQAMLRSTHNAVDPSTVLAGLLAYTSTSLPMEQRGSVTEAQWIGLVEALAKALYDDRSTLADVKTKLEFVTNLITSK